MGREVRRVPEGWTHPRKNDGQFEPLFELNQPFEELMADYVRKAEAWEAGIKIKWDGSTEPRGADEDYSYEEYAGAPPREKDYMPYWPESERTMLVMYEDTSEGTPISPAFKTAEELAQWLADNKASSFADRTASYDQWLATIKSGFAPSAVLSYGTGLISGVEAMGTHERR